MLTTQEKIKEKAQIKDIGKIVICHYPPGNISNYKTLTISKSALQAHLDHGDVVGACPGQEVKSHEKDTIAPSVPTNLTAAAVYYSKIQLAWTASIDNVAVKGYKVYRNGVKIVATGATSYLDTGLTASTSYSYTVAAYDVAGNISSQSESVSATTFESSFEDLVAPSVPADLTATAVSSSQINLAWTVSTDNVGVAGYKVYRGGAIVSVTTTNNFSDIGLTASTSYSYNVAAYDAAGNISGQSNSASATTLEL